MRIIVSAGGTGGHIYPALAIINKIKERHKDCEILYIGTTDRMESTLVPSLGIKYEGITMKGLNRKNIFKNFSVIKSFYDGIKRAKEIIKGFKPDIVLGIGGYITAPVIIAAHKLGIKTFIHEQNSIPGLSNKILKKYVDVIGVSLKESMQYFKGRKVIFTGNPRSEEAAKAKPVNKEKYGLTESKKLVLFVMGSLGSLTITNLMHDIIPEFKDKNYEVLFVTGKNYFNSYNDLKIPDNVKLVSNLDDMLNVLKKTDLIVTRAGASTIAEITAIGIPAIMIPSPYVTHNHQEKNAEILKVNEAAIVIKEKDLTKDNLLQNIDSIISSKDKIIKMKKNSKRLGVIDSATKIVETIEDMVNGDV